MFSVFVVAVALVEASASAELGGLVGGVFSKGGRGRGDIPEADVGTTEDGGDYAYCFSHRGRGWGGGGEGIQGGLEMERIFWELVWRRATYVEVPVIAGLR